MTSPESYIQGCKSNDVKSQKLLYEHFSRQMYSICLRYCKNESDAADVLQEGFVKVFQNIKQFRDQGSLAGWIRIIMVRSALSHIKKRVDFLPINEHYLEAGDYQMEVDFDTYNYNRLLDHLRSLPIGYQTVFNLFVFEEMSHAEIAEELKCTENTSRSQLFKARKMMQKLITQDVHLNALIANRL